MFAQLRELDKAFVLVRRFALAVVVGSLLVLGLVVYWAFAMVERERDRVYILAAGKALEAFGGSRKDNLPVELRDHIRTFHHWFFTLDPDDKVIRANVGRALDLADESARRASENLREQGYYNNIISANISQEIEVDSVSLDLEGYPYGFVCHATQRLVRSSATVVKKLVTRGKIRNVSRSDANPHGFLLQRWEILENGERKGADGR